MDTAVALMQAYLQLNVYFTITEYPMHKKSGQSYCYHGPRCARTRAMIDAGQSITWEQEITVDKHCVGGLPGNRTTPIVVSIVAPCGLTMPKTSSRAITSPAGTADTMETLAPSSAADATKNA